MGGFNEEMTNLKCNLHKSLRSKPLSVPDVLACVTAISNYLQKQKIPVDLVREHTLEIVESVFYELFASDQTIPELIRPVLPATIDAGLNFSSRCFAWASSFFSRLVKPRVATVPATPVVVAGGAQAEEVHLVPQGATEHAQLLDEEEEGLHVRVVPVEVVPVEVVPVEPVVVLEPVEPVVVLEPVELVESVQVVEALPVQAVYPNPVFQSDLD